MIKRAALGLALSLATVRALAVAPAGATTTGTSYDFAAATATPQFFCTDIGCGALTGYTYTGAGACSAGCVGFPPAHSTRRWPSPWFAPSRPARAG